MPSCTAAPVARGSILSSVGQVLCPVLVGRTGELDVLRTALSHAADGRGGTVLIIGEAGIGKSRLVRELGAEARSAGLAMLTGRAVETATCSPFRPLVEALLGAFRSAAPPDTPELRPFRGALSRLVPEWADAGGAHADEPLLFLAEGVLRLLTAVGGTKGCLVVLEDVHWADPETLEVLDYLSDNLGRERVLCVAMLRSEHQGPGVALARALAARRSAAVVELSRLGDEHVRAMALACLAVTVLPTEVESVVRRADGLPFLVEELLSAVLPTGLDGSAARMRGTEAVVPASFAESVRRRVAHLGAGVGPVLQGAAVLGHQFDAALLETIVGAGHDVVLERLEQAVSVQLLTSEEGVRYRFRHPLTRDAILHDLLPSQRVRLARRSLDALEANQTTLDEGGVELAAGLAESAGETARAARLFLEAGRRALSRGALVSAETVLGRARDRAPSDDVRLLVDIDDALTEVLAQGGDIDHLFEIATRLLRMLVTLDAPRGAHAAVHLRLARAAAAASWWETAREHEERARRAAEEIRDDRLLAALDAVAAQAAAAQGRWNEALELARAAVSAAERLGLAEVTCEALEVIGRTHRSYDLATAEQAFRRALETADREGLEVWRVRALHELGTVDVLRAGSVDRLRAARDLAYEAGAFTTAADVDLQLAGLYLLNFSREDAASAARRCAEVARRYRMRLAHAVSLVQLAAAHGLAGRRKEMDPLLREARAVGGDHPDLSTWTWGTRAMTSLVQEDRERALGELEQVMAVARASPGAAPGTYRGLWALIRALAGHDGDQDRAEVAASGAATIPVVTATLAYAEAVARGRQGDVSAATNAFAEAERIMSTVVLADGYRHLCRRLVAEAALAHGWGDPAGWLRQALAFFESAECRRLARGCRSLLAKAGVPVPRGEWATTALPERLRRLGISPREAEVLGLVAERLTNQEIARRLCISARTVEKHVERLMHKTGTSARTELAVYADVVD